MAVGGREFLADLPCLAGRSETKSIVVGVLEGVFAFKSLHVQFSDNQDLIARNEGW